MLHLSVFNSISVLTDYALDLSPILTKHMLHVALTRPVLTFFFFYPQLLMLKYFNMM